MAFKRGDRVVCKPGPSKESAVGVHGTVIGLMADEVLVEFDIDISGHDGNGFEPHGRDGHCWWFTGSNQKFLEFETIRGAAFEAAQNGWVNSATHGFAMVLFNDAKLLGLLDKEIIEGQLQSLQYFASRIKRDAWWEGEVDAYSVIMHRIEELYREGRVAVTRFRTASKWMLEEGGFRKMVVFTMPPETVELPLSPENQEAAMAYQTKEEITMIKTVAHVDYVNGKNVKDITLEEQVALIQQTEAKIKEYSELTTKTKKIEKEIAQLKENLAAAVILFDAE